MRATTLSLAALAATALAIGACGSSSKKTTTTTANAPACTPKSLATHTPGQLTIATDSPAYPPYFEDNKPANGKGFESAVAFAIGKQLGYTNAQIKWVVEPFDSSYAPGPKKFDFDVNEISITPQRAKAVDFAAPYFTAPQAIVVKGGSKLAGATSLSAFKDATIGVQVGTTSLDAVNAKIKPSHEPRVFNTSDDVVEALKAGTVDAIVVDLPTAFYITSAQVTTAKIAGQFSAPGGDTWGPLLAKNSALTACVTKAVTALRGNGTLAKIQNQWMGGKSAPNLT